MRREDALAEPIGGRHRVDCTKGAGARPAGVGGSPVGRSTGLGCHHVQQGVALKSVRGLVGAGAVLVAMFVLVPPAVKAGVVAPYSSWLGSVAAPGPRRSGPVPQSTSKRRTGRLDLDRVLVLFALTVGVAHTLGGCSSRAGGRVTARRFSPLDQTWLPWSSPLLLRWAPHVTVRF